MLTVCVLVRTYTLSYAQCYNNSNYSNYKHSSTQGDDRTEMSGRCVGQSAEAIPQQLQSNVAFLCNVASRQFLRRFSQNTCMLTYT